MKKLTVALVAIAAGIAAHAANYSWTTNGRIYDGSGNSGSDYYAKGLTAYLMFASTITQKDLVSSFNSNAATAKTTVTGGKVTSATINSEGKISQTGITYDTTAAETAYFVIFNGDKMYVSGTAAAVYDALNPTDVNPIDFAAETSLSRATLDASKGYTTAGWYEAPTSPVPEPTSAMLLLLGFAGLVLKRKNA